MTGKKRPVKEQEMLQEMFDRMSEILSDDLLERYTIEEGPYEGKPLPPDIVRLLWLADLNFLKALSLEFGAEFDHKEVRKQGELYLGRRGWT